MGSDQLELFDRGPSGPKRPPTHTAATPMPVGSGPDGEFCKTCKFLARPNWHGKRYLKCYKMRSAWTHGAATDIKANWPACRCWRPDPSPYDREIALMLIPSMADWPFPEDQFTTVEGCLVAADYLDEDGEGKRADKLRKLAATSWVDVMRNNLLTPKAAQGEPPHPDGQEEIPF